MINMSSKTVAFCVGYGVTMAIALVVVRLRTAGGIMGSKKRPKMRRNLSYLKVRDSASRSAPSSPRGLPRRPSQGSQMGALHHPANRQTRRLGHWTMNRKLVLVMVGLPARGKSYITTMLIRYLNWIGFPTKVFNIGDYRRKLGFQGVDKSFFEKGNAEGMKIREKMVEVVQDEMYTWLQQDEEAKVAIFDATNTTRERRQHLLERAREEKNTHLVFIESICDDPDILAENYKLKLQNNDYKDQNPQQALTDFMDRVRAYEQVYETIEDYEDEAQIQYIKLYNVGQKVVTRNCKGYLPSQVAFYLQNIHIGPRKIWLTRHAESVSQVIGESGADAAPDSGELTESGRKYSMTIAKYIKLQQENIGISGPGKEILVLAGTQTVDSQSIAHLQMLYPAATTPLLNELHGGSFTGMSRAVFRAQYPDVHAQREADKLDFRFPGEGGESYMDVIQRVRPIIVELERQQRSLIVVCHLAVQRCLYAYFMGIPIKEVPHIDLPQHTLTELVPTPFGTTSRHIPEAVMEESW